MIIIVWIIVIQHEGVMRSTTNKVDVIIKGVMLGDFNVGKSSVFQRFIHGVLRYNPTIGVDFQVKDVVCEGHTVRLHLWDTAGQERFRSIVQVYVRNIYLFFVVIDVTQRTSLEQLGHWVSFIQNNNSARSNLHIVLLVNKTDLPKQKWAFTRKDVHDYCSAHPTHFKAVHFISATRPVNTTPHHTDITEMYTETIRDIYKLLKSTSHPVKGIIDHRPRDGLLTPPGSPPRVNPMSNEVMTILGFKALSPQKTHCCTTTNTNEKDSSCCY